MPTATIQAHTPCQVLAITAAQLAERLAEDAAFAAHFYRLQAILVMHQSQSLIRQFNLNPVMLHQINVNETSSLFAELQDSDLDWLIAVGQRQQLPSETILQPAYRSLSALHIVLEGALSLHTPSECHNSLTHVFSRNQTGALQEPMQEPMQELARIARGDVFGERQFVALSAALMPMPPIQVQTVRDTDVLSIPGWRLRSKLLHDPEFAMRFYRFLANLVASNYQALLAKLGFMMQPDTQASYSSEALLTKVARAEAHFEWMVKQMQTKVVSGGDIQW